MGVDPTLGRSQGGWGRAGQISEMGSHRARGPGPAGASRRGGHVGSRVPGRTESGELRGGVSQNLPEARMQLVSRSRSARPGAPHGPCSVAVGGRGFSFCCWLPSSVQAMARFRPWPQPAALLRSSFPLLPPHPQGGPLLPLPSPSEASSQALIHFTSELCRPVLPRAHLAHLATCTPREPGPLHPVRWPYTW